MRSSGHRRSMTLAVLAALALPGAAQAAAPAPTKPEVTTKAASNVGESTAQLNGAVTPNGAETTYFFQIGPTSVYGINTPATAVGKGTKPVNVSYAAAGLAPATTYHFRIVARSAKGLVKGKDRTFKTHRQPLGLALNATANPVAYGAATTLTGQLTGTGNAGQQVVLQANPFPYTQGFANVWNPLVTLADGTFTFAVIDQTVNTQYRVVMPDKPSVASPIVTMGVKVAVHTKASPRNVRRGNRVRFSGTIAPAADGSPVLVQKRHKATWVTVAHTVARHRGDGTSSSFRRRVKLHRGGTFRVLVNVTDGAHAANVGRSIRIHTHR